MPSLADIQSRLRDAVVTGQATAILPLLVGGQEAAKRLAIHRRHYETSLVTALLGKFPATAWLVGTPFLTAAARQFVREHSPSAPCIAEYGEMFPAFLVTRPRADGVPYLRSFAELEWHVGRVSIAVDRPAIRLEALAGLRGTALPDARLILQPGLRHFLAPWPVDELMTLYLNGDAPDHLSFEPAETPLEIRGARGEFAIRRLSAGDLIFRSRILEGWAIGDAAESAFEQDERFDPGRALRTLVDDELVTAVGQ